MYQPPPQLSQQSAALKAPLSHRKWQRVFGNSALILHFRKSDSFKKTQHCKKLTKTLTTSHANACVLMLFVCVGVCVNVFQVAESCIFL